MALLALFDWIFFRLDSYGPSSYRQSSRFIVLVLFLEAVGVREYCCTVGVREYCCTAVWQSKIGWQLRAFPASNACFACDEPSSKRVGGVEPFSHKPPKLRLWHCTQPRAAKAGVAVAGKMASIPRAAVVV